VSCGSEPVSCFAASRRARRSRSPTEVALWRFWVLCATRAHSIGSGLVATWIRVAKTWTIYPNPSSSHGGRRGRQRCLSVSDEMNAERATYLDSSAIVKLVVDEPESAALRRYLRRRRPLVSSALARTEVARALLPLGPEAVRRGHDVLARIDLARVNDRVLLAAGKLLPADLRSLDAIHLATAQEFGSDLARIVTYDDRMAAAARALGFTVSVPD